MPLNTESAQQQIERIVETYSDMLLRLAMHHTQNLSDAQDIVQTAFLKLVKLSPLFSSEEHEKAWLIRVTINQSHDTTRSSFRRKAVPLEDYENLPAKEAFLDTGVLDAVRTLPEKYKTIVFLYYYEGYSTAEIASLFTMSQNTVESRLHRARAKLRTLLEGEWT